MDIKTYLSKNVRGTAARLASDLSISPSYLSQMASGDAPISPERCVEIENATSGKVTRKDLRPSDWDRIWPELRNTHDRRAEDKEALCLVLLSNTHAAQP